MEKFILITVLDDGCMVATKHESLIDLMEEMESYNYEVVQKFEVRVTSNVEQ